MPTESLYDLVEEARPTIDEDGEPIDDQDPYETSREEIGELEGAGVLDHDEEGMAGFGYSSLTDEGLQLAEKLEERGVADAEVVLRELAEILWPGGDADHEWDSDTLGEIGEVMYRAGLRPPDRE